jgi:hypothetical protein
VRLLVFMRDGRTVYRVKGRGVLARLVRVEPWHEEPGALVDKGVWNPTTGEYLWTVQAKLRFIAKGSISHVEEDHYTDAVAA